MSYSIATFCYGERYYGQTNRMIESFESIEDKPEIFIVTDSPSSINKTKLTHIKDISEFNPNYSNYNKNYYHFDFSVKRFSLQFAFENGYNNVILTDTDVIVNPNIFSHQIITNSFIKNSISGQVTYNFNNEIKTHSMLGRRLLYYENKFNKLFDKTLLDFMPEDCIQFISIDDDLKFKFLKTWDECINIKYSENLLNVPAGNIDEMCFSALYNGINVSNNSNKSINTLIAKHEKWY